MQIRSIGSLGHRVNTLKDTAARMAIDDELTPRVKLQRRKNTAWTKIVVERRQWMLEREMKKIKKRLANAKTKAEKEIIGEDAMRTDNA